VNDTGGNAAATVPEDAERLLVGPYRRCIASGESSERSRLLRFVLGPGGELVPDVASVLPGRGLWLTPRRDIVERAVAKRLFARAARQSVSIPPGLADRVEALLAQRCCETIGLGRRAGIAVAGFEKVNKAVHAGKAALLLEASDGAERGRNKIRALGRGLPIVAVLTGAEMGAVFGRDHVVHVAMGQSRLSTRLMADAAKLAGFRAGAVIEPRREVGSSPADAARDGIGVR
jgi:uncharacterized protein